MSVLCANIPKAFTDLVLEDFGSLGAGPTVFITEKIPLGDFNENGRVDFGDFLQFAANFGKHSPDPGFDSRFDLNENGSVDFPDFLIFAANFG